MLGWEFPPFIAGGLGVACYGLTRALDRRGHEVVFILPKPVERPQPSHVRLLAPAPLPQSSDGDAPGIESETMAAMLMGDERLPATGFEHVTFRGVPASFHSPYPGFEALPHEQRLGAAFDTDAAALAAETYPDPRPTPAPIPQRGAAQPIAFPLPSTPMTGIAPAPTAYSNDLVGDADRYARLVVALARREEFDVIHAHDWLTYPAGMALAKVTRRPLVVHVHSTEFDRAGNNINDRVFEIERAGMLAADRVIAVSQFTRSICERRYGIPPEKVDIVYNGIDTDAMQPTEKTRIESTDKVVLFLGRITMQKGPEYFIAAAKRVLEKYPDVKFVLAGSGDMALRMIELAAGLGIGHKVLFTGFLRGKDVDRVFRMADCYVMPSVSEPFGLAALEAISHDVPVILSKTSGASEVLTHVLKVDFWDIDEMANKILAVLRHPPLSETLREHGAMDLHRLTWEGAAERCVVSYEKAMKAKTTVST